MITTIIIFLHILLMSPSSTFSQKDESFFERSDLDKLQAETQRILEDEDAVRVMAWRNGEGVGDVKLVTILTVTSLESSPNGLNSG